MDHGRLQLSQLWERLTSDLSNIYDAHHVCVAAAQVIAEFSQIDTVVIMQSSLESYFDVWRVRPSQRTEQLRWWDDDDAILNLINTRNARLLQSADLVQTQLANWFDTTFLLAPFQKSNITMTSPGAICLIDPPESVGITPA
ncbi:MAG: hypothetical protein ACPG8W_10220, partial [Candidatus Promineifilaceae bacterium]